MKKARDAGGAVLPLIVALRQPAKKKGPEYEEEKEEEEDGESRQSLF